MLRMMFKTSIHEHSTLSWTPNEAAIFDFTAGDDTLKSCRIMPNVIVSTAIQIGSALWLSPYLSLKCGLWGEAVELLRFSYQAVFQGRFRFLCKASCRVPTNT